MKKRDLTREELNLIVNFYIEDYRDVADEGEDFEIGIREDIEGSVILTAVDTKFGTFIIVVTLKEDEVGDITKTVSELLINLNGDVEEINDWEFISVTDTL